MPNQKDILALIASNPYYKDNLNETDIRAKLNHASTDYDANFVLSIGRCFVSSIAMVHPNARSQCTYFNAFLNLSANDIHMETLHGIVLEIDVDGKMRALDKEYHLFAIDEGEGTVRNVVLSIANDQIDVALSARYLPQAYTQSCLPRCTLF